MGILDKLFGSGPDYPALSPESEAGRNAARVRPALDELAKDLGSKMEVVPSEETTYVFCGKPPGAFGLVWIRAGRLENLKDVVEREKMSPPEASALIERLAKAYDRSRDAERYAMQVGDNTVVVTPSDELHDEVEEIVARIAA